MELKPSKHGTGGQTMYDELVKRLREKAGAFDYDGRPDIACDYEQAADAIEKLEQENSFLKEMQRQLVKDVPLEDLGRMVYAGIRRGCHV
jgi:predicted nuclease with TOPRIM domain